MEQKELLETFFADEVDRALKEQGVTPRPLTEHYVVNLLAGYVNQPIDETPLALRLLEAREAAPRERRHTLREIGDTSLYVSGFWSESFARRVVDVDYYIGMGETAYGELAHGTGMAWSKDPWSDVFRDLSANFPRFVKALTLVSRRVMPEPTPKDIVWLFEKWTKQKSEWARAKLLAMGVVLMGEDDGGPGRLQ